jgi:gluconate 2-dehydrogenase gamma chain
MFRADRGRTNMAEDAIPRRSFLKGAGVAGAAAATAFAGNPSVPAQAQTPAPSAVRPPVENEAFLTLTATEAAFLSAAYDT